MSSIYPTARQNLLDWAINGGAPASPATLCMIGVTSSYVYSAAHETLTDVGGADICISEQVLSGVTIAGGVMDADDLSLSGITTGPTLQALIVYLKWGTATQLICYVDSATDSSLPQVLTTDKVNIGWSLSGICKI